MYWTIADGFVQFQLLYPGQAFQPQANQMPTLALTCNNCGNTIFLNLFTLGLGDLSGLMGLE
ncbi:MAG TPA: hypothetical protein VIB47_09510 [Dehalococcoidia bacterium]|jgi:hypothetical protein